MMYTWSADLNIYIPVWQINSVQKILLYFHDLNESWELSIRKSVSSSSSLEAENKLSIKLLATH